MMNEENACHFINKEDGLYYNDEWISKPIEVIGCRRNADKEEVGRYVKFNDPDEGLHIVFIPKNLLIHNHIKVLKMLLNEGFMLNLDRAAKKRLIHYIRDFSEEKVNNDES